jgi:hypothetical protein
MTTIGPGLPFNAARAYGLTGPGAGARPFPGRGPAEAPTAGPVAAPARPGDVRQTTATAPTAPALQIDPSRGLEPAASARISQLVGGRVPGRVDFTGSAPTASRGDVLPLYTRAADKVEASVAVRLGSALDLRG